MRGHTHEWAPGEAAISSDAELRDHRMWRGWNPVTPTERHALLQALHALLPPLPHTERDAVMRNKTTWADAGSAADGRSPWLSEDEFRALTHGGLVEAGAHSVSHSLLAGLPEAAQREEIERSQRQNEEIAGRPPRAFAYPYGKPDSYTPAKVRPVR